jgi:multidrug efflux pump subunit AcrA (membrane-fusion protein)
MIRKYLLPILAIAGVIFAIRTVIKGRQQPAPAQAVSAPSLAPYVSYVAGAGIIEANTENIEIGTPVGNIISEVFVKVGDRVKKGDPLFRLRDSVTAADLEVKKAAVLAAKAKLEKLKSQPRPEDLPPAMARVAEAQSSLEDSKSQLALWESVTDKRAVSRDELDRRRYAVRVLEAKRTTAQAELKLLQAGAWAPDIAIAEADVVSAQANVKEVEAEIERRTVPATVDGQVLQVKTRPGEYAQTGPLAVPLIVIGSVDPLVVRVDVDENDAWRISPDARATAFVRGNTELSTPLKFVRIEPYIVPKKSLTGESTERVDTRVLQVLYSFERGKLPVYVGQQMDVFIDAPPIGKPATSPTTRGGK